MSFDPQALFANLSEKERMHGHHSAAGRTIRALSRALNGWSAGNLAAGDVIAMCDQAIEDWLKARLEISPWSATSLRHLIGAAVARALLTPVESARLEKLHDLRSHSTADAIAAGDVEAALLWAIEIVERRWS